MRRIAEQRLDGPGEHAPDPEDPSAILHELRVHQIELEMQNEELQCAQLALQASYEKYFELFDRAPIGYLTLSEDGVVDDTNLTAMRLLGLERPLLVGRPFGALVIADDCDRFYLHQVRLHQTGEAQTCELRLRYRGAETKFFWAHFAARLQRTSEGQPPRISVTFTDITEHKRIVELLAKSLSTTIGVVNELTEAREPHTPGHERRVSALATCISEEMGLSVRQIEEIRIAALVHDIDKIDVPTEILEKPGRLSPAEFELVKRRTEAGHRILDAANMDSSITNVVAQYHERCDGSGYPRGLTDPELLKSAKVLMVAEVVEAMVSDRPYRRALGIEAALAEISAGAGRVYDAEVCSACTRLFREGRFEFPSAQLS